MHRWISAGIEWDDSNALDSVWQRIALALCKVNQDGFRIDTRLVCQELARIAHCPPLDAVTNGLQLRGWEQVEGIAAGRDLNRNLPRSRIDPLHNGPPKHHCAAEQCIVRAHLLYLVEEHMPRHARSIGVDDVADASLLDHGHRHACSKLPNRRSGSRGNNAVIDVCYLNAPGESNLLQQFLRNLVFQAGLHLADQAIHVALAYSLL